MRKDWIEKAFFDRNTVWCTPPELGRQVITFLLNMWVERPYTTSCLIILPRTFSACYKGLSRFIRQVGIIHPFKNNLERQPVLPIPYEVFYIASNTATLPIVTPTIRFSHPELEWHRAQAETMRGLPPVVIGNQ